MTRLNLVLQMHSLIVPSVLIPVVSKQARPMGPLPLAWQTGSRIRMRSRDQQAGLSC